MHFVTVMRVDNDFHREGVVTFADLGIGDRVIVIRFPSNEASEALAATVDEVKPEVIGEWTVPIGAFGITQ